MPLFTLHRNYVLRTTKGHSVGFVKDKPTWVPPECVPDAVAIGALAVDGNVNVLPDEERPEVYLTPDQRQSKLFEAFESLIARNERGDFTGSGLPNAKKLSSIVGFEVTNVERNAAWMAFTANQTTVVA